MPMSSHAPRRVTRGWAATCRGGCGSECGVLAFPPSVNVQGVWGSCLPMTDTQTQQTPATDPCPAAGPKPTPFSLPGIPELALPPG